MAATLESGSIVLQPWLVQETSLPFPTALLNEVREGEAHFPAVGGLCLCLGSLSADLGSVLGREDKDSRPRLIRIQATRADTISPDLSNFCGIRLMGGSCVHKDLRPIA